MNKLKVLILLVVVVVAVDCSSSSDSSSSESDSSSSSSESRSHEDVDSAGPLFLSRYIESGQIALGRKLASVLQPDLLRKGIKSYSGYLTVDKAYDSNLFFWYFPAKKNQKKAPVLLWLQGGKQHRTVDATPETNNELSFPRFAEPIPNITVTIGRDALLGCVVDNLKNYKVAWVRVDTQTILSIHHNVITQNSRVTLTFNNHRSWYLHIREVEESDRGWYMCQVNTDPMRSRKGYLQVVVPPVIIESMTSNDMVVREGTNVSLMCKARGYPEPYLMWRREDGDEMSIAGENVNVVDGEMLLITKVSRLHMAAYLCVASNGVPPSISKRVQLRVQFPPMLSIPNQLEGAYQGQDVTLECHTEAYPASINYWTTDKGDMIISDASRAGDKYETSSSNTGYSKYMKLKIRSVGPGDFGSYRCVAKNSLGETDGLIKLDEIPAPTTIMTTEVYSNRSNGKRPHRKPDTQILGDYGVEEWRDGDYNGDFTSPSRGPPPIRHPPGAFHNSVSSSRLFSFFRNLVFSNSLLYACRQLFCSYSTMFATR